MYGAQNVAPIGHHFWGVSVSLKAGFGGFKSTQRSFTNVRAGLWRGSSGPRLVLEKSKPKKVSIATVIPQQDDWLLYHSKLFSFKLFYWQIIPTLPGHPQDEPEDGDDITAFAEAVAEGALYLMNDVNQWMQKYINLDFLWSVFCFCPIHVWTQWPYPFPWGACGACAKHSPWRV